jgi:hypothetical protein
MDFPLRPIVTAWISKIKLGMDHKKKKFQDDADEGVFFFHGPYDELYGIKRAQYGRGFMPPEDGEEVPKPSFAMTVNKTAEMVQLFGPVLYHRNPIRQVNPRKPPEIPLSILTLGADMNDPMQAQQAMMQQQQVAQQMGQTAMVDQVRAALIQQYQNYTPTALDLKTHSRWAIDEAIIKGMGCLWTELYHPAGANGRKLVGSFFETVDNLVADPDMESLEECKWIARRCVKPTWEVEDEYSLPPGSVKANLESYDRQAEVATSSDREYYRKQGKTNDLLIYWKIYSKMGMGGRLSGSLPGAADVSELRQTLDRYGKYCYLVLAESVPFPLNLPNEFLEQAQDQDIMQRVQWPTPFWADDTWPFTPIAFHWVPREIWPMSHLKPALGELKFMNWAYSMLAGKIKTACRDLIAVAKSAGEDLKSQIVAGGDYSIIEVEAVHGAIDKVVQFLQHPAFHPQIVEVIQLVEKNFERRTGLSELMYGQTATQLRSATEADVKQSQMTVRPDDMANKVEDAMSDVARKEALAARWHLDQNDVEPILGAAGAQLWMQYVMPSDPAEIIHSLEYRIEAGSTRKPNKARDAANMAQAMQTIGPQLWQHAQATGDVGPYNKLIIDWAKSVDLDPTGYTITAPPPPQAPMPAPPPGPPARNNAPPQLQGRQVMNGVHNR